MPGVVLPSESSAPHRSRPRPTLNLRSIGVAAGLLALVPACVSAGSKSARDAGLPPGESPDAPAQQDPLQPAVDAGRGDGDAPQPDGMQAGEPPEEMPVGEPGRDAQVNAGVDSGTPPLPVKKCVVMLHGKGGTGFSPRNERDYLLLGPTGNADGWGAKQWLYFPDNRLQQVRDTVAKVISDNACTKVVIHGFSNGAATAAKLYCRGNNFGGAVVGYVVDDPVPDHGADGCAPAAGVKVRLYWTGGLSIAQDGWNCGNEDWTCEGGETIGIQKYAGQLRTQSVQSIHEDHILYEVPPEYGQWL